MSTINHDPAAHRFTATVEDHLSVLDYTLVGDVMSIMHTNVPPAVQGRGIAAELMAAALSAARAAAWTVNPVCTYAVEYLRKQPLDPQKQHIEDLLDEGLEESFPASDSPAVGGTN